ncbi:type II toxin-antitoxin system HicB family antitoxin [Pasteurella multocida]|uniref:type II toxin-antitoxin system HicB family antitoxin n=1 Tax=Pasteurella multocida TaxID=747 RepID=UPI002B4928F4|nr:type II toxin-antitoxin system HicB family antitoxin [Pasteurella multocida]MEB3467503.1 type II toxin-antitoxin system HicB family antitoxin [Pasteurella multocida]WRK06670.1 type II toxin-antitoxin system HicB family antitoxin [Pasteurella multocida]HDR1354571.1 type II toxin-antitoxin system HicB family antitoxin [Pasteurella multocida]
MSNTLQYKDFIGSVETSIEDNVLFGKILFINALVTYEADTISQLKTEFELAVDDYIKMCEENNIDAGCSFAGGFKVRISPELHKKAVTQAAKKGIALNAYVANAIEHEVAADERDIPVSFQYMSNELTVMARTIRDDYFVRGKMVQHIQTSFELD